MALIAVIGISEGPSAHKWESVSVEEFQQTLSSAVVINENFTLKELQAILTLHHDVKQVKKRRKAQFVNQVCALYGDGSVIIGHAKNPKTLVDMLETYIKNWKIHALNVAFAQLGFMAALQKWDDSNIFAVSWTIETEGGKMFHIPRWYAQPTKIAGNWVQPVIDPHHLLVNNRCRCCSVGMEGMDITPSAWWKVADRNGENDTGLSVEIAKELRDRQRNAFAQTTFSEAVELEMLKNGDMKEAEWCRGWVGNFKARYPVYLLFGAVY